MTIWGPHWRTVKVMRKAEAPKYPYEITQEKRKKNVNFIICIGIEYSTLSPWCISSNMRLACVLEGVYSLAKPMVGHAVPGPLNLNTKQTRVRTYVKTCQYMYVPRRAVSMLCSRGKWGNDKHLDQNLKKINPIGQWLR